MSDQQVKYTITADATQANSELTRVDKAVTTLVGNEKALATETMLATRALERQGAVATQTAAKTLTLREQIGKSAEGLSKQAAAVSLVSSSMQGMGGQVGKLVAGAGQMAAAYGAGGPFALALVGGMAAIQGITSVAMSSLDKQEKAFDAMFVKMDAAVARLKDIQRRTEEIRQSGLPEGVRRSATVKRTKADIDAEIAAIRESGRVSSTAQSRERDAIAIKALEDSKKALDDETEAIRKNKLAKDSVGFRAQFLADAAGKKPKGGGGGAVATASDLPRFLSSEAGGAARARDAALDADIANQRWTDALKAEEDARKEQARMDAEATKEAERQAAERVKIAQEEAKQKRMAAEEHGAFIAGQITTTAGIISQAAVAAADGQAAFGEVLLAGLSQQAGGFITLKGAEVAAAGAASAILGNPAGIAQAAAGASMIALGQAVAVGGPSVAASLFGGGGQGAPDASAARDRGASPGRGGGGSGGGNLVVNVSYGAGGPLPEDTAREIAKATNTGRRRGAA
jgi:hypothetical protein